jgi:DNA-binding transcriptional ArsR family regulator
MARGRHRGAWTANVRRTVGPEAGLARRARRALASLRIGAMIAPRQSTLPACSVRRCFYEILRLVFVEGGEWTAEEPSQTSAAHPTVTKEIRRLEGTGLVLVSVEGRTKYLRADRGEPASRALRRALATMEDREEVRRRRRRRTRRSSPGPGAGVPNRWTEAWEQAEARPAADAAAARPHRHRFGGMATDRGGRQGVSMNGAGHIAGLLTEVLPAAIVVEQMAAEAAARLTAR